MSNSPYLHRFSIAFIVVVGLAATSWIAWQLTQSTPPSVPEGRREAGSGAPHVPSEDAGGTKEVPDRDAVPAEASQEPGAVAPAAQAPIDAGQEVEPSVKSWVKRVKHGCQLSDEQEQRLLSDAGLRAEVKKAWQELAPELANAATARSEAEIRIKQAREKAGQFTLFRPGERLPDPDPRVDEWISYGYERNPAGGRDLVQVFRIMPGEDQAFDQARNAERLAQQTMRDVVGALIQGR